VRLLLGMDGVLAEVVKTWMGSAHTGVGERAARVLGDLLEVDCEIVGQREVNGVSEITYPPRRRRSPGDGAVWRLLFNDGPILTSIVLHCSLTLSSLVAPSSPELAQRTNRQITISQGRLLRLLPRLAALDIRPLIARTALFTDATVPNILGFAALDMVDRQDVLMALMVVDFFETLVSVARVSDQGDSTRLKDQAVGELIKAAIAQDSSEGNEDLERALRTLPDRTVEEEAEGLRSYLRMILN
jgi:hypothetical protein